MASKVITKVKLVKVSDQDRKKRREKIIEAFIGVLLKKANA
jgi:hypothetical protein